MSRSLSDVRLAVMMLDGLEIADRTHVVALGISTDGVKIPLGLWEGSTENATLVSMLLADLVDRGLDPEQAILFVIVIGGKALRKAIKGVFGERRARASLSPPQGAQCHRDLLPRAGAPADPCPDPRRVGADYLDHHLAAQSGSQEAPARLRTRAHVARRRRVAARGDRRHAVTLMRLGIDGQLAKTLTSTNPCESMIEIVRYTQRNVKRWQDGDMRKRWTAAGMLVAEQQFRRIIGYRTSPSS